MGVHHGQSVLLGVFLRLGVIVRQYCPLVEVMVGASRIRSNLALESKESELWRTAYDGDHLWREEEYCGPLGKFLEG